MYVNAIHTTHKDISTLMLSKGKHVLSEKPIAVGALPLERSHLLFASMQVVTR